MGWFSSKVAVSFIDDRSNVVVGVAHMEPANLPETFEIETTLQIQNADWFVVHAMPTTRAEHSKSKRLTLRLRPIEKIDLSKILYSLPTICDFIQPIGQLLLSGEEYLLAEDDWRQFELVARRFAEQAEVEIEFIRKIHENESAHPGWRKVHLRRTPEPPIVGSLTLADVAEAFGISLPLSGVSFRGAHAQIESGYSFKAADGQCFYGVAPDGKVSVLAIAQERLDVLPSKSVERLARICEEFDLDLVHWCRCARAAADNPLFRQLLEENVAR